MATLSPGAIAGLVIGCVAALLGLVALIEWERRQRVRVRDQHYASRLRPSDILSPEAGENTLHGTTWRFEYQSNWGSGRNSKQLFKKSYER